MLAGVVVYKLGFRVAQTLRGLTYQVLGPRSAEAARGREPPLFDDEFRCYQEGGVMNFASDVYSMALLFQNAPAASMLSFTAENLACFCLLLGVATSIHIGSGALFDP